MNFFLGEPIDWDAVDRRMREWLKANPAPIGGALLDLEYALSWCNRPNGDQ